MDETLPSPPDSAISPEDWQQTPNGVQRRVIDLCAEVAQLRETVEIL